MTRALLVVVGSAVAAALLVWAWAALGSNTVWFAFVSVWVPMAWLGTLSRVVTPRLPAGYHALRRFECSGRCYELLGVRLWKRLLRRGPFAVFNPDLHLPAEVDAGSLARLEQRMRDAEASHAILLVATVGVMANAAVRRWWGTAAWTALFDVLVNCYPAMLQRYNRARLRQRFGLPCPER